MEKTKRHIGIVSLPDSEILKLLDFNDEGRIVDIRRNQDRLCNTEVIIEHPDMPEIIEGCMFPSVLPLYTTHQDAFGNKVTIRIKDGVL